ncbi:MAG: hypothetical protein WDN09_00045 [bacterium]
MNPFKLMLFVLPGWITREGYGYLKKYIHGDAWYWRFLYVLLLILVFVAFVVLVAAVLWKY